MPDKVHLLNSKDVIGGAVHRTAKEYSVYDLGYEEPLGRVKRALKAFDNLQLIGRNGLFRNNNMDHSIAMGLYAAENLLGGRYDIESVNVGKEYLEVNRLRQRSSYL